MTDEENRIKDLEAQVKRLQAELTALIEVTKSLLMFVDGISRMAQSLKGKP